MRLIDVRGVRGGVALVLMALAAVGPGSTSPALGQPGAPPGRVVTMSATACDEVQMTVQVPIENAQAAVPEGFTATEGAPGNGTVAIGVRRCDAMSVDGASVESPKILVAEVGVFVNTPKDSDPGRHFYQIWGLSTVDALSTRTDHLGLEGDLVPEMSVALSPLGGTVSVPWPSSPYGYSVNAAGPAVIPMDGVTFTWWHDGPRGRIRSEYVFPPERLRVPGPATITAAEGSPLAQLLGASTASGLGAVISLPSYEGRIELMQ